MAVQWFGLNTSTAGGSGLIPGWGTEVPQVCSIAKKRKKKTTVSFFFFGFGN